MSRKTTRKLTQSNQRKFGTIAGKLSIIFTLIFSSCDRITDSAIDKITEKAAIEIEAFNSNEISSVELEWLLLSTAFAASTVDRDYASSAKSYERWFAQFGPNTGLENPHLYSRIMSMWQLSVFFELLNADPQSRPLLAQRTWEKIQAINNEANLISSIADDKRTRLHSRLIKKIVSDFDIDIKKTIDKRLFANKSLISSSYRLPAISQLAQSKILFMFAAFLADNGEQKAESFFTAWDDNFSKMIKENHPQIFATNMRIWRDATYQRALHAKERISLEEGIQRLTAIQENIANIDGGGLDKLLSQDIGDLKTILETTPEKEL